jgi:hypothetical protein
LSPTPPAARDTNTDLERGGPASSTIPLTNTFPAAEYLESVDSSIALDTEGIEARTPTVSDNIALSTVASAHGTLSADTSECPTTGISPAEEKATPAHFTDVRTTSTHSALQAHTHPLSSDNQRGDLKYDSSGEEHWVKPPHVAVPCVVAGEVIARCLAWCY